MGLGGDGNNPAGPPEETAGNTTENDTGDPTSGKEKTTAGSDTRSMRYCIVVKFILYLASRS